MSIEHASKISLDPSLVLVYIRPSSSHEDKKASGCGRESPSLHSEESLNGSQLVSAGVDLAQWVCMLR